MRTTTYSKRREPLTQSVTECQEFHLTQLDPRFNSFGEFNLPTKHKVKVIAVDSEDEEPTDTNHAEAFVAETEDPPLITPGTLPPDFYHLHVPAAALSKRLPPFEKAAPPTSEEENRILHIYIKATRSIQVGMPDVAGLMKIHDFLEYQCPILKTSRRSGKSYHRTVEYNQETPSTCILHVLSGVYSSKTAKVG